MVFICGTFTLYSTFEHICLKLVLETKTAAIHFTVRPCVKGRPITHTCIPVLLEPEIYSNYVHNLSKRSLGIIYFYGLNKYINSSAKILFCVPWLVLLESF